MQKNEDHNQILMEFDFIKDKEDSPTKSEDMDRYKNLYSLFYRLGGYILD